ncbi:hypothetical protein PICMEDRAFT_15412 [Pichia membranifaciens NRRL Y-2026]|uniref:glucan endo-1,3-beta-D-glucosidase n=1 Tax=Pichia membranifaciens NRRL Y-2026 TaxID=763406 RepID=A0A1E3NMX1_9ASCO|nr:hypothetical protein PICMEDRAFT_15412 [Pichia membranifaciens NRRL Y-2026]ODQ47462.1 hypothetical protein PICMEDRAFT_15412 [Pichia membranifaciens NRRL Y-2026]
MGLFKHLVNGLSKELHNHHQKPQNEQLPSAGSPDQPPPLYAESDAFAPPPIPKRDYMTSDYTKSEYKDEKKSIANPASRNPVPPQLASYVVSQGIFDSPISTAPPVGSIQTTSVHPVPLPSFYDQPGPIETNNFYGNFLVEDQNLPVWTHPYSVWKSTDDQFKGLGISHTEASQRVYGDDPLSNPVKYFFNPVGICSMMLSAEEFQSQDFDFRVGDLQRFSAGVKLIAKTGGELHVNVVQGMGFITGIYDGRITPRLASKVGIQNLSLSGSLSNGIQKYLLKLFDNTEWVVYSNASFSQQSANSVIAQPYNGQIIVQIAKLCGEKSQQYYDEAAGSYVTGCTLSGDSKNGSCSYSFNYAIAGSSRSKKVLQWFLPHQINSMDQSMRSSLADGLSLDSTCKGSMSAFLIQKFIMVEQLPPEELKFDPWSDVNGVKGYSDNAKSVLSKVAQEEIQSFDVVNESDTDSMYTAGKILDKGAFILYVAAFVLQDDDLTLAMLGKMKQAFSRFIENRQKAPLCYENNWKGIVSTSGLNDGNFYCDFGNCFYNDHHFHYGYHIHAASLVALVDTQYGDGNWVNTARPWIETLIRDICNPNSKDMYFPVFRSFDFFNGHSFANGLFAHGDGKDEESSSEDYHAYYGIKLWATVTNNIQLLTVASLILSIEKRAMDLYMLYRNDNKVMPPNFIRNKVSGILFENKVDHATYFGMNKEYIHGIHMIPLTPMSNYIRSTDFVTEEWNEMALGPLASSIDGGWKGLLMLNLAIYNPQQAWEFFSKPDFQMSWLDNGMSRTWSLAYCAGMGGC